MALKNKRTLTELLAMKYPEYGKDKIIALIACRKVKVDNEICCDPRALFHNDVPIVLIEDMYVSRGGVKLDYALNHWSIDPSGKIFLDAGSSTGGFTDCLLRYGARLVHAVDVGYNQLDYRLRTDARVIVHERQNIMDIRELEPIPDAAVADLSFRSIHKAASHLFSLISGDWIICLVKPQFEIPKGTPGFNGVVDDPLLIRDTLLHVKKSLFDDGIGMRDIVESPIHGRKGNREFLALLSRTVSLEEPTIAEKIERLTT
ncbi:MAG: TlyA family RNA methyltransferase [Sphaerochaetaceae bacterium]|jgi:23S rRNA (cytidine1920-2'-O)/16S rRNA (cytidine1409-2'-O)-methyltransferase|nr:TlyA family RNA methyltransferase [Sphaerochaetaceae bacterium]NLO59739.1 TlyA family RNA methyltransferase [Spirochaetales bacterium]MDD2405212.1 TlyA family RNA methyltransferase [Sphaerochaetaceae bacterium]MDD3669729.1 TlyA family RNA methyltransferase [Sphaerochaetaceae bacterium]MDD4258816.1 TlyA family RNA methyltransferase [Sphaerochaetaceae bacterium]